MMAEDKKSIFDFQDKFGIESPFGDWEIGDNGASLSNSANKENDRSPRLYPRQKTGSEKSKSGDSMVAMQVLSNPLDGIPGRAKIEIYMKYLLVTEGEGKVDNHKIISTKQFLDQFSKGDLPGKTYKTAAKFLRLPSKESEGIELTLKQLRQSKNIDNETGWPKFWEYYETEVRYNFSLEILPKYLLWDALREINANRSVKGVVLLLPFEKAARDWNNAKNHLTIRSVKSKLPRKERKGKEREDFERIRRAILREATIDSMAARAAYVIQNLIKDDESRYRNKTIFFGESAWLLSDLKEILVEKYLKAYLTSISARLSFAFEEDELPTEDMRVELLEFREYSDLTEEVSGFCNAYIDTFEGKTNALDVGAAGNNEKVFGSLNVIVLSPKLFGKESLPKKFSYAGITPAELLVHEAGHNSAAEFRHNTGNYEYNQVGLQGNSHTNIYPTLDNTIAIINDPTNRKEMVVS